MLHVFSGIFLFFSLKNWNVQALLYSYSGTCSKYGFHNGDSGKSGATTQRIARAVRNTNSIFVHFDGIDMVEGNPEQMVQYRCNVCMVVYGSICNDYEHWLDRTIQAAQH